MLPIVLLAAATVANVRTVQLTKEDLARPIKVECPAGQETRIVFPERFVRVKATAGSTSALGLSPTASKPVGILVVQPPAHPARATVEVKVPSAALTLVLETAAAGRASEVRLALPVPDPKPVPAAPPPPPVPPAGPLNATPLDLADLVHATQLDLTRSEKAPGNRLLRIDNALQTDTWVWLNLMLLGGGKDRVENVLWSHGEVTAVQAEVVDGRHLRLVVQLPRAAVSDDDILVLRLADGTDCPLPLRASWAKRAKKNIFG